MAAFKDFNFINAEGNRVFRFPLGVYNFPGGKETK